MNEVAFTKMHGLGNDFMVVDNRADQVQLAGERIARWANRHTGIGFDQLLVVSAPSSAEVEFDYRIFNADGSEVEHCGNGARCFARYVVDQGLTDNRCIKVNTQQGMITLMLDEDGQVTVQMGIPRFEPAEIPFLAPQVQNLYELQVNQHTLQVGAASIGNPHVLLRVDDVDTADVAGLGPLLERHERFPNRVNVGFMQVINRQHIRLRVFERGVGETRACGSGACAAMAIAHRQGLLDERVTISLTGGDLKIHWPNQQASIEMTGPCSTVFVGKTRI